MKDKQAVRDLILALAIVIVASGLYIGNRIMNRKPAVIVEVSVDGVVVEELDLSKDGEFVIQGHNGGTNTLVLENGQGHTRLNHDISPLCGVILNRRTSSTPQSSALQGDEIS